jgi:co-chaperonin GroES (HSP10)
MSDITKSQYRIIYPARVVDVNDPMDLGRVRAEPETQSILAVMEAYNVTEKSKWNTNPNNGPIDPFVVRPLLPLFVSLPMVVGERINIIYQNSLYPWQDAYYVHGTFSSPMAIPFENFQSMKQQTGEGAQITPTLALKNKNGEYNNPQSKGVFPQPGDYGLMGRGSADIIIKKDELVLRAGKTQKLSVHEYPSGYTRRSFIQLSNFKESLIAGSPEKTYKLQQDELFVKYLVEWDIQNLDNTFGRFTGSVNLYRLPLSNETTTESIRFNSDLGNLSQIVFTQQFTNLSFDEAKETINTFISNIAFNSITVSQTGESGPLLNDRFPFVFKPSIATINSSTGTTAENNFDRFYNNVMYLDADFDNPSNQDNGFGIVLNENSTGKPTKTIITEVTPTEVDPNPITYGLMGGDKIMFLSHLARTLDIENTVYGLTQEEILNLVLPQTSSMVRGEELMYLLNLIVKYLISHVHPYHGLAAVPVGTDGTTSAQILKELNDASQKILNQHIRLN